MPADRSDRSPNPHNPAIFSWHPACTRDRQTGREARPAGDRCHMTVEYIWIQGENGATMMAKQPQADPKGLFGEKGMTFKDALDIINPLQQIPIIGSIYRHLTGDTISDGARLIGGGLYGLGVGGIVSAAISAAVEQTTGNDPGGTVIAMLGGKSLGEQIQTAQAAREKAGRQVASVYTSGGADPIDPAYLPKGAKLVDVPSPVSASQLAALPPDAAAAPAPADAAAAAAPVAGGPAPAVTVSSLPPLIGAPGAAAASGAAAAAAVSHGGGPGASAGDPGLIPQVPGVPAGATGLSAISHLPTPGSITPAGAALTMSAVQTAATPTSTGLPPAATTAVAKPSAAANQQAAETVAAGTGAPIALNQAPRSFPVPPRTNNITPRMPVAITPANVGTQPLALSTPLKPSSNTVTVSAPQSPAAPTPTATPAVETPAAVNPMAALPPSAVPDAMMRALDKYDALMRTRRNSNGQVDQSL